MSIQELLSTNECSNNGIFIVLDRDNIHLLHAPFREKVSSYIETKREDQSEPQIVFRR